MVGGVEEKKRIIKLYCPSMAKIVQLVAWEEQRLDLGSIAGAFGLDPATLKINGHFISRGVDFIASSVTWKSLLSFFSARGLSTGSSDFDALTVDGKLSKPGSKRVHDPATPGVPSQVQVGSCPSKELQLGDYVSNKRIKESIAVARKVNGTDQETAVNCSRMKRKSLFRDTNQIKRERRNPNIVGMEERKDDVSRNILNKYPCNIIENTKRVGEEDLVASVCKRIKL